MKLLCGVTGKPVLHSKSPQLHRAALNSRGSYVRIAADSAAEAVGIAKALSMRGLNVTAPFKEEAFRLSDHADPTAARLCAANTLILGDGVHAWNTDVDGVLQPLRTAGVDLARVRALVLGAGGAARAAVSALQSAGAAVTILNRTFEKARNLSREFGAQAYALDDPGIARVVETSDVILSCVSTTGRVVPPDVLRPTHVIMDSIYKEETALVSDARKAGARVISGLEWLLAQGASAYTCFTGEPAPVAEMRAAIERANHDDKRSIALVGMMGSGKSTVARSLSEIFDLPAVDLDVLFEEQASESIREFIEREGESRFREIESQVLEGAPREGAVLACGGGLILNSRNRALLQERYVTVWLWAPPSVLARRVSGNDTRPLLTGHDPMPRLTALERERRELYAEVCDLVIDTASRSISTIAERIAYEISAAGYRFGRA